MKSKKIIMNVSITLAYLILVSLLLFNIFRLPELYNKEEMEMVLNVENEILRAVEAPTDQEMIEIVEEAREKYQFEIVITRDEDIVLTTIPYDYGDALLGRSQSEAIARESQGPYNHNGDSLFIWYSVYRLNDSIFINSFLKIILIIVGLVTVILALSVYIISKVLFTPLINIKESLEYAKKYDFNRIEDDQDVITKSFKDFTTGLQKNITTVSRQHTELEMQLQANRDYLNNILVVSKSMVHDLKTPIHRNYLESDYILSQNRDNEDLNIFASHVKNSSHEILMDINTILKVLNEESDIFAGESSELDLVKSMMNILRTFNKAISDKNLQLDFDAPDSLVIKTDEVGFMLLVNNILSNIVLYATPDSVIEIYFDTLDTKTILTFTNESSEENIGRMKDSEQLFNAVKDKNEEYVYSSGNGLYLIKELSRLLGAHYNLETSNEKVVLSVEFNHEEAN